MCEVGQGRAGQEETHRTLKCDVGSFKMDSVPLTEGGILNLDPCYEIWE